MFHNLSKIKFIIILIFDTYLYISFFLKGNKLKISVPN